MFVLGLQPEGQASGLAHSEWPMELLLRNAVGECCCGALPPPCSSLPVSLRNELTHLSEAFVFVTAIHGTPSDPVALVVSSLMLVVPQERKNYFSRLLPEGLAFS